MRRLHTLFIGRAFHDLPSVDSTNAHALLLLSKSNPPGGTVISTRNQTAGRGQIGSSWESEPGQNISLSIILYPGFLLAQNQFLLNQAMSLAMFDLVSKYLPKTKIKWPNDIYVGDEKIAGILIQNSISGSHLRTSVVGIGLNVNQTHFTSNAPNPTSFKLLSGKDFELDKLIAQLCQCAEQRYLNLKAGKIVPLQSDYRQQLYRLEVSSQFQRASGEIFQGKICGVSPSGKLQVQVQDKTEEFDLKQIKSMANSE